jgi:hypothetical protein
MIDIVANGQTAATHGKFIVYHAGPSAPTSGSSILINQHTADAYHRPYNQGWNPAVDPVWKIKVLG